MEKPKIGEKFFLVDIGNRARYAPKQRYCEVVKVGSKYFTVAYGGTNFKTEVQFSIENRRQKTEYCEDYSLFASEQAWADAEEVKRWGRAIEDAFRYGGSHKWTVEQLRSVGKTLGITLDT